MGSTLELCGHSQNRCDFVQFLSDVGGWFRFLPIWGRAAGAGQLMLLRTG
jgi:hypothetical protein